MESVINELNKFLSSKYTEKDFLFSEGFFLKLKKHIKKGIPFLEIHTSGYDDTLEATEALEWIKWTLFDYEANGIVLNP